MPLDSAFAQSRAALADAALAVELEARSRAALGLLELVSQHLLERRPTERELANASDSTELDHFAQGLIVGFLRAHPATQRDEVQGEELKGGSAAPGNVTWFSDPIDSTLGYIGGAREWGSSLICVDEAGQPLVSALVMPAREELYLAAGDRSWLNGSPLARTDAPSARWVTRAPRSAQPGDTWFELREMAEREAAARGLVHRPGNDFTALDMLQVPRHGGPDLYAYFGAKPHDALCACHIALATGCARVRVLSFNETERRKGESIADLLRAARTLFPLDAELLDAAAKQHRVTLFVERAHERLAE